MWGNVEIAATFQPRDQKEQVWTCHLGLRCEGTYVDSSHFSATWSEGTGLDISPETQMWEKACRWWPFFSHVVRKNRFGLIHRGLRKSAGIVEMPAILSLVIRRNRFFDGLFTWDSCMRGSDSVEWGTFLSHATRRNLFVSLSWSVSTLIECTVKRVDKVVPHRHLVT